MVKRFLWVIIATVFWVFQVHVNSAAALELSQETLTVPLNEQGKTVTLTSEQESNGQRLFIRECTQCHLQGKTKTNNNVSLGVEDLSKAEPSRYNLLALVDYLKNPTSYDGEDDYSELHPNVSRPDLFPELKDFTEDDVFDVAGYMLVAPKLDERWGGSIYY